MAEPMVDWTIFADGGLGVLQIDLKTAGSPNVDRNSY